jgi:histidinol-phosphatase (PHP family)
VIVDYHMHLRGPDESIQHTVEAVEPFVKTARQRGVDEIGFTEHVYYFRQTRSLWRLPYQAQRCNHDLDEYVDAVLEAKRRGLPVKLGLEVDYVRGREEDLRELLAPYPWDYLLGSVHYVADLGVDSEPRLIDAVGVDEAWRLYFERLGEAARSGLFDALSHPDLVKIFGVRPQNGAAALWDSLSGTDVAVEVSTAGLRKPVGELYPDPGFLERCHEHGLPITLASDAHDPSLVGENFDRALELARGAGYDTVTVFEGRQGRQEPLG